MGRPYRCTIDWRLHSNSSSKCRAWKPSPTIALAKLSGAIFVDLQLKHKRVIILGGTRGIGRAIAETFADEGADVALCARKAGPVSEMVVALKNKGARAFGASVDIADGASLRTWIAKAAGE